MSKFSRIVVLVTALVSLLAATSATAGAVTWTNTGPTSFHATGGPGTLGATGSGGTNNLSCADSTETGAVPMDFTTVSATATFTTCVLSGTPTHTACSYTFFPTSQTATVPAVTTVTVTVTCVMTVGTTPVCRIQGPTPAHYVNPNGATPARITFTASSSLVITNSSGTSCSMLLGTSTSGVGHLTEQTMTLTGVGTTNPFIVRDA